MIVQQFAKALAKFRWFAIQSYITRKFARFLRVAMAQTHSVLRA